MGLLSVMAMLFQGGVLIYDDYINSNTKNDSKERAIKNNSRTYIDNHGREYDVRTNKRVTFAIDNGDKVYRDSKTWQITRNISAEERASKKEINRRKAMEEGKRFFYDPERKLYCEIATGEYYKRFDDIKMDYATRYSSIKDGRTVYEFGEGPTDEEIKERHVLYEHYKELESSESDWIKVKLAEIKIRNYDQKIRDKYSVKRNGGD